MTYLPWVSQHCKQEVKLRTGLFTNISVFFSHLYEHPGTLQMSKYSAEFF